MHLRTIASTPRETPKKSRPSLSSAIGLLIGAMGIVGNSAQAEPAHPILAIPAVANSTTDANSILNTWSETTYVSNFVPHQSPRDDGGGFADAVVPGDTSWYWNKNSPNQIISKPSGVVFPGAAGYTQQTQTVTVLDGSTVAVPYYIAAGTTTQKSFVQALIDLYKRDKLRGDLGILADAYMSSGTSHATRNQAYARRIGLALYEWGKYVPKYFSTGANIGGAQNTIISTGTNFMATDNMQRCSSLDGFGYELSSTELLAFDAIYDSPALATLSTEKGLDVREFIRTNLLGNMGDFFVYHTTPAVASIGNLPGATQVLAQMARVLNRPDYLPWLDSYFNVVTTTRLNREGVILESLGYSINYIRTILTGVNYAGNYFLSRPADTQALVTAQSHLAGYAAVLQGGINNFFPISVPNGQFPAFGDTTDQGFFLASTTPKTSNAGSSGVMGAYGTASLGAGTGANSVQLNTMFAGDANHKRSDTAAFVLYAFSNEYLGNIRYFNGSLERQFDEQPIAHNMVEIDRTDMSNRSAETDGNGDLTLFESGTNGLAVTEIDGQRIYSAKASRYQRILMLNTKDLTKPYMVDVFRVTGGTTHDYALHGAIMWNQSASCSFPLVSSTRQYPLLSSDSLWVAPTSQYANFQFYGMFRNVSTAVAPGDFQITYRDTSSATSHRDVRMWMTDGANDTVNVGRSPVPAREHHIPPSFFTNGIWRPSTIITRSATNGTLSSLFVSVIEPMKSGTSTVQSVERIPMSGSALESCGLKVTLTDGRVDTYIVNLRNPEVAGATSGTATVTTADGKYSLTGRIGATTEGPAGSLAWGIKATDFKFNDRRLVTTDRHYEGTIIAETRKATGGSSDAFITTTPLPVGTALRGKKLKVTFGTLSGASTTGITEMFAIDQVTQSGSQYSIVFPADHCLEITTSGTTSKEQQFPNRKFTGLNTFEIDLGASAAPISDLPDTAMAINDVSDPIAFSFGDLGATPAASLQLSATSSNPALISGSGISFAGAGANRTLSLTPLPDKTGTSLITVSVTDSKWTSSRNFTLTVTDPGAVFATQGGALSDTATWGGTALPVAGDGFTWRTGAFSLTTGTTQAFSGGALKIDAGGQLLTTAPGTTLTLTNLYLNGGTISVANNNGLTINLNGGKFFLLSGTLKTGIGTSMGLKVQNAKLAGSGTISVVGYVTGTTPGSSVEIMPTTDTRGFNGIFNVSQYGILNLPPISTNAASFGLILSGSGASFGKYLNDANVALTSLTIGGASIPNGVYTYSSFTPAQQAYFVNTSNSVTITVGPSTNTAPTISDIGNVSTDQDTPTPPLLFTVGDAENTAGSLTLSGSSSDTALVPNSNIVFAGSGTNRSVVVTPAPGAYGTATISVTVSDGVLTATDSFVLSVNGAPTLAGDGLADLTIDEDTSTPPLPFTVGDDSTSANSLQLSADSSNPDLVPNGNIVFSGSGANRTVTLTPLPNANGITDVTVSVSDGNITTSQVFELTVNPVNDAPTIGAIANQTILINSSALVAFGIDDIDNDPAGLQITATSSNPAVVPVAGIVPGGSGTDRNVTITPTLLKTGSSVITVTVDDGDLTASRSFVLVVEEFPAGRFDFEFNQDGNFEGWAAGGNGTLANTAVASGALSGTIAQSGTNPIIDPQLIRSTLNSPGNNVPVVLIRMKSSAGGTGQLFWSNEVGGITGTRSVTFPVTSGTAYKWYALDLSSNAEWAGHTIKSLRFDPPGTSGSMSIDAIIGSDGDYDNDGLPDLWEAANGLDPSNAADAQQDSDGDGISNLSEYILGTSSTSPNIAQPLVPSVSGTNFSFSFTATAASGVGYAGRSRFYDVQTSGTLGNPASWSGLSGYTGILGAGQTVTVTQPLTPSPRFFRLKTNLQ